ncbi:UbiA prenyltransferase family protein [Lentzea sp. NPDC092896]|uniref:UbiA prenyltransferase family protein n=1 Tax=Lentzea sp. NPDC092896 TaxID=3364127 RepID=UPI0038012D17
MSTTEAAVAGPVDGLTRRPLVAEVVSLVRLRQWPKNVFATALPLVGGGWTVTPTLVRTGWAVLVFTCCSALIYVVNDLLDRERDRMHPVKRFRPIASGRVSVRGALALNTAIAAVLVAVLAAGPWRTAWPAGIYLVTSVSYSLWLKHIPIVDVFVVASGFVLRVLFGAVVAGLALSNWLLLGVLSVSLLLSIGKRRAELAVAGETALLHRPSLRAYSTHFADQLTQLTAVLTMISFVGYLRSSAVTQPFGEIALLLCTPFVLFGLFRYVQILSVEGGGGNPTRILVRDRGMVASGLLAVAGVAAAALLTSSPALVEAFGATFK